MKDIFIEINPNEYMKLCTRWIRNDSDILLLDNNSIVSKKYSFELNKNRPAIKSTNIQFNFLLSINRCILKNNNILGYEFSMSYDIYSDYYMELIRNYLVRDTKFAEQVSLFRIDEFCTFAIFEIDSRILKTIDSINNCHTILKNFISHINKYYEKSKFIYVNEIQNIVSKALNNLEEVVFQPGLNEL